MDTTTDPTPFQHLLDVLDSGAITHAEFERQALLYHRVAYTTWLAVHRGEAVLLAS